MQLVEPQWGVNLLQQLNTWASSSQWTFHTVAFFADATILLFPIFLLVLYINGMYKNNPHTKIYALRIFFSAAIAAIINILLQVFIQKSRPETVLEWAQRLLLNHLPTMSFPSDHAAVSMAFSMSIILWATIYIQKNNTKKLAYIWMFFIVASIIMWIARVAVWVHRPTDIIAGWFVWIVASYIGIYNIPKQLINFLITIETTIMKTLWNLIWK